MPETRHVIAMPEFRAMERRPMLIDTARGGLVDEAGLVRAFDEGLISGADFDAVREIAYIWVECHKYCFF